MSARILLRAVRVGPARIGGADLGEHHAVRVQGRVGGQSEVGTGPPSSATGAGGGPGDPRDEQEAVSGHGTFLQGLPEPERREGSQDHEHPSEPAHRVPVGRRQAGAASAGPGPGLRFPVTRGRRIPAGRAVRVRKDAFRSGVPLRDWGIGRTGFRRAEFRCRAPGIRLLRDGDPGFPRFHRRGRGAAPQGSPRVPVTGTDRAVHVVGAGPAGGDRSQAEPGRRHRPPGVQAPVPVPVVVAVGIKGHAAGTVGGGFEDPPDLPGGQVRGHRQHQRGGPGDQRRGRRGAREEPRRVARRVVLGKVGGLLIHVHRRGVVGAVPLVRPGGTGGVRCDEPLPEDPVHPEVLGVGGGGDRQVRSSLGIGQHGVVRPCGPDGDHLGEGGQVVLRHRLPPLVARREDDHGAPAVPARPGCVAGRVQQGHHVHAVGAEGLLVDRLDAPGVGQDLGSCIGRPPEGLGPGGQLPPVLGQPEPLQEPHPHQAAFRADPDDPPAVPGRPDQPGTVRPVGVDRLGSGPGIGVLSQRVPARDHPARELGVGRVQAGVDHGHRDLGPAGRPLDQFPGPLDVDAPGAREQVPLARKEGIGRSPVQHIGDHEVGDRPPDLRPSRQGRRGGQGGVGVPGPGDVDEAPSIDGAGCEDPLPGGQGVRENNGGLPQGEDHLPVQVEDFRTAASEEGTTDPGDPAQTFQRPGGGHRIACPGRIEPQYRLGLRRCSQPLHPRDSQGLKDRIPGFQASGGGDHQHPVRGLPERDPATPGIHVEQGRRVVAAGNGGAIGDPGAPGEAGEQEQPKQDEADPEPGHGDALRQRESNGPPEVSTGDRRGDQRAALRSTFIVRPGLRQGSRWHIPTPLTPPGFSKSADRSRPYGVSPSQ